MTSPWTAYHSSNRRTKNMPSRWGLIWVDIALPAPALVDVKADISIIDLIAEVRLSQTFHAAASAPTEARYVFPVPDSAAVCAFDMKVQDRHIVGLVKEKAIAKKTYEEAVAKGHTAGLGGYQADARDVFEIDVGNIPPNEDVVIGLTYAVELHRISASLSSVNFVLPTTITPRYGTSPPPNAASAASVRQGKLLVSTKIVMPARITSVSCPSHTVETTFDTTNTATIEFTSSTTSLSKKFELTVGTEGDALARPRAYIEIAPPISSDSTASKSAAVSLSLIPVFKLPPPADEQSFIFVIDRSGSMTGARMTKAKEALIVLLRGLPPSKGTRFNIVSFGSSHSALWTSGAEPYDKDTLSQATEYVDAMEADMGGTELGSALSAVLDAHDASPTSKRSLNIFVLTDGDIWQLEQTLETVSKRVAPFRTEPNCIRIFSVGIGNEASTSLCEGLARVGDGASAMVGDEETTRELTGKVSRLVRAAKAGAVLVESIDWGLPNDTSASIDESKPAPHDALEDDFEVVQHDAKSPVQPTESQPISLFDPSQITSEDYDTPAKVPDAPAPSTFALPPPPQVQQTPHNLGVLYPGIRYATYALLTPVEDGAWPKEVVVRGRFASNGTPVELKVPLTPVTDVTSRSVHTLAVKRLMTDLLDGKHWLLTPANTSTLSDVKKVVKAETVRLGTSYNLASQHTCFVAVDGARVVGKTSSPHVIEIYDQPPVHTYTAFGGASPSLRGRSAMPAPSLAPTVPPPPPAPEATAFYGNIAALIERGDRLPLPQQGGVNSLSFRGVGFDKSKSRGGAGAAVRGLASSMANLWGSGAPTSIAQPKPAPAAVAPARSMAIAYDSAAAAPPSPGSRQRRKTSAVLSPADTDDEAKDDGGEDVLAQLARAQQFDGSFVLDQSLKTVIGTKSSISPPDGVYTTVWATLLAMVFMEKIIGAKDRDSWESLWEKAKDYVDNVIGVEEYSRVRALVEAAF